MKLRRVILAFLPLLGALATLPFAWAIDWVSCENDTSEACARQDVAGLEHAVAWAGLVPALAFMIAFLARRRLAARIALTLTLVAYASWAVLANSAVHP